MTAVTSDSGLHGPAGAARDTPMGPGHDAEARSFRAFLLAFAIAVCLAGGIVGAVLAFVPGALAAAEEAALAIAIAMAKVPICH